VITKEDAISMLRHMMGKQAFAKLESRGILQDHIVPILLSHQKQLEYFYQQFKFKKEMEKFE